MSFSQSSGEWTEVVGDGLSYAMEGEGETGYG